MSTVVHTWVARAKCGSGYLWSTPGSPNVTSRCGGAAIIDHVRVGGMEVTDEAEFKAAVAADIGVSVDELTIVQG